MPESKSLKELQQIVEHGLSNITYPGTPTELFEPIRYTLSSGGKRIRPTLLLATYDWLTQGKGTLDKPLPAALAVEVFHNFTLLHDDIMDKSALRRGRATVWDKWGANVAILSGDAMTILAYQILEGCEKEKLAGLLTRFNALAMGVCKGQQWDMMFEECHTVSLAQYLEMVQHKTADLIEGSVRMGAYAASTSDEVEELLGLSAREMGIAFQLQDDWLDVYGETEVFGKECGDDIADNKQTYLSILAAQDANPEQRKELTHCAKSADMPRTEKIKRVETVYTALDIRSKTVEAIETHLLKAEEYLQQAETIVGSEAIAYRTLLSSLKGRAY